MKQHNLNLRVSPNFIKKAHFTISKKEFTLLYSNSSKPQKIFEHMKMPLKVYIGKKNQKQKPKTVNWNVKCNSTSTEWRLVLKYTIRPNNKFMHTESWVNAFTFMLKEETCLAQFGLQMTAVVTAQEKATRVLRVFKSAGTVPQSSRADWMTSTCRLLWIRHVKGLELRVFALL